MAETERKKLIQHRKRREKRIQELETRQAQAAQAAQNAKSSAKQPTDAAATGATPTVDPPTSATQAADQHGDAVATPTVDPTTSATQAADQHGDAVATSTVDPATSATAIDEDERPKATLQASDITGLKYFEKISPRLEPLHDDGCERDTAGNQELHFDKYCLLVLLHMFNPMVNSLRGIQQASELEKVQPGISTSPCFRSAGIQQASELEKVQQRLDCSRVSLGSLSEATGVFDADRLVPIIQELGAELEPLARDSRLSDIQQTLVLVDGTLISALPNLVQASWRKYQTGSGQVKWRLHTHFEVDRDVPTHRCHTQRRWSL
jgi:hypothetical protein